MTLDMDAMTGTHLLILAGSAFAVALVAAVIRPRWWRLIALVVGALFPAYTLAGALMASSNLLGIAVAIAAVLTMVPAYVGAGAGELIGRNLRAGSGP